MQFIGRVMREIDPAPIRAMLDARREVSAAATAALHQAEQWRDRLLTADQDELAGLVETLLTARALPEGAGKAALPSQEELLTMTLAARKEAAENTSPQARRALFRAIHGMLKA